METDLGVPSRAIRDFFERYNNFPWPEASPAQKKAIESAAQQVLDVRSEHAEATLADLYDPLSMPPALVKAHEALDRAVDAAYGRRSFKSDAERVAFLFERYLDLVSGTAPLPETPKKRQKQPG